MSRLIDDIEREARRCADLAYGYRLMDEVRLGVLYGKAAGALSLAAEALVLADAAAAQAKEQACN